MKFKRFLCTSLMVAAIGTVSFVTSGATSASAYYSSRPAVVAVAQAEVAHANVSIGAHAACHYHTVDISAVATNESHSTITVEMKTRYGNYGPNTMRPNSNSSFVVRTSEKLIGKTEVEFVGHQVGKKKQVVWFKTYVSDDCRSSH